MFIDVSIAQIDSVKSKLMSKDVAFVAQRDSPDGQTVLYFNCRTVTNASFLVELKFKQGFNVSKLTVKSPNKGFSELCKVTLAKVISA